MNGKIVMFDMDGVILDSEKHWRIITENVMSYMFEGWSDDDTRKIVGMSVRNIYKYVKNHMKINLTLEEFQKRYDELAITVYREKTNLMPGVLELMKRLKDKGVGMALVSSSRRLWIDTVMDRFSIRKFFDLIVSSDDLKGDGKPAPDIYLIAAKKLDVDPKDCVVIEDSENGVKSAKAAGMFCVGYRNDSNGNHDLSETDVVINDLGKVEEMV